MNGATPNDRSVTAGARSRSGSFWAFALLVLSGAVIGGVRPRLAERFQAVVRSSDDYLLPSTEQTLTASLGYRAALADLIYAHVLVSYGIHFQEKHNFEFVGNYLDTINALDPQFRGPYRYADTLLTIQPTPVGEASYRKAREVLERGLKALPYDTELWNSTGQFLAYIAAPRLSDAHEAAAWRLEGARKLARACELAGNNENVPYHCINAATLLNAAGEHAAMNKFLTRFLAVNDDPQVRTLAIAALRRSAPGADRGLDERQARINAVWKELPFVTRTALFVLGPYTDTARCAGLVDTLGVACASSWDVWSKRQEQDTNDGP